ncbi:hypothetical protein LIER_14060 [Lithospermum erythrorhizon]|uniref:Transposase (putative) gypsy type domain-containing protein n=1 Tax=Lithospermum erythrorhizon TaxID=34254 RepID=A0AAV3Q1W2_LITER
MKVTETSAIALGHLRHFHEHYHIDAGVKLRVPLDGETIDNPLVNFAANEGDPIESGYIPVCWEFLNYGLRLPSSTFINNVLSAIDRAPCQIGPLAWATLTTFQVGCLSVGVVPSLNFFSRILDVAHTGVLLHFHTRPKMRNMLYHGKPGKASPTRWHKYWFLAKDAFSDELEDGFPNTLEMDVFCDPDVLINAGLSRGYDNFQGVDLANLLRAKEKKAVVPHQVSYLDIISGNRLINEMLAPEAPSSSVQIPLAAPGESLGNVGERPSTPLLTPIPVDQQAMEFEILSPAPSPLRTILPFRGTSPSAPSWDFNEGSSTPLEGFAAWISQEKGFDNNHPLRK